MSHRLTLLALVVVFVASSSGICHGHFLWLKTARNDGRTEAVLYFSEAAHVDGTRVPDRVRGTKLDVSYLGGQTEPVELAFHEQDAQADMRGGVKEHPCSLSTHCEYGVYQGFLLSYDAEHVRCSNLADLPDLTRTARHTLDLVLTAMDGRLIAQALYRGQPISGIEILVVDAANTQHKLKSDADGKIEVQRLAGGLVGLRANYVEARESGERDGTKYEGAHYYATMTIDWPGEKPTKTNTPSASVDMPKATLFATLPEPITSFGAAYNNGHLYVYGGHVGTAHDHSRDNLSTHFRRYNFHNQVWEELSMERPLQGLALVSHGKWIYRVGGMEARNAHDQPADMHSTIECARFSTETLRWERIPDLPLGRSSHDAVVSNNQLFVIGGWNLAGESEGTWHDAILTIDLNAATLQWRTLAEQPSRRRALAVTELDGKIYAVGGIDDSGEIDRSVDLFDVATHRWSTGPALPGEGMNGFGVSAWNHDGSIYASGVDGIVYRLNAQDESWVAVAHLNQGRFFHRLVSYPEQGLLAVGGASRKGHIADIELLPLSGSVR